MSANFDKNTGSFFITNPKRVDPFILMQIEMIFEENTEMDIKDLEIEQKQVKLLKKVCWVKILSYPFELTLTYLFLGKGWVQERKEQQQIYKDFLKNKMDILTFNNTLADISDKYLKEKGEDHA